MSVLLTFIFQNISGIVFFFLTVLYYIFDSVTNCFFFFVDLISEKGSLFQDQRHRGR